MELDPGSRPGITYGFVIPADAGIQLDGSIASFCSSKLYSWIPIFIGMTRKK